MLLINIVFAVLYYFPFLQSDIEPDICSITKDNKANPYYKAIQTLQCYTLLIRLRPRQAKNYSLCMEPWK